jgi:hypothetical protein
LLKRRKLREDSEGEGVLLLLEFRRHLQSLFKEKSIMAWTGFLHKTL